MPVRKKSTRKKPVRRTPSQREQAEGGRLPPKGQKKTRAQRKKKRTNQVLGSKSGKGTRGAKRELTAEEEAFYKATAAYKSDLIDKTRNPILVKDAIFEKAEKRFAAKEKLEKHSRSIQKDEKYKIDPEAKEILRLSFTGALSRKGFDSSGIEVARHMLDHFLIDAPTKREMLLRRTRLLRSISFVGEEIIWVTDNISDKFPRGARIHFICEAMQHRSRYIRTLIEKEYRLSARKGN